ncbi:MAG: LysR substrate-binding domain-containing protein [Alphaproteobacteria bacterium]|jgi:LysR family hydrogen peroxide-inducible transcriptional activator|nr:LysR substrate-binding domain-containing protein [Alphaproteobacteria bacterium]
MNLRDLKYLIAVAKHKHFGKAAEACFVSQPTLSYQIKKLEEYLGVKIFDRDKTNVFVTPVGREILEKAEKIVFESEQIINVAKLSQNPFGSELTVGVIPTIAPYLLPKVTGELRAKYPDLKMLIKEDTTNNLLKDLEENRIDVMVQALPIEIGGFKYKEFHRDEFLVAVPDSHEWAKRKSIKKEELNGENVLLLEKEHCLTGHIMEQLCQIKAVNNKYDFRATSLETLRHMVLGGVAITIMPKIAINNNFKGISYIPFSNPKPYRTLALVWKESSARDSLIEDLASDLEDMLS